MPRATLAKGYTLCRLRGAAPSPTYRTWKVPNEKQRLAALKLLKKMNVTNIRVRMEKP